MEKTIKAKELKETKEYRVWDQMLSKVNVDCLKCCPIKEYSNLLLVGLYELIEKDAKTIGGYEIFDIESR